MWLVFANALVNSFEFELKLKVIEIYCISTGQYEYKFKSLEKPHKLNKKGKLKYLIDLIKIMQVNLYACTRQIIFHNLIIMIRNFNLPTNRELTLMLIYCNT